MFLFQVHTKLGGASGAAPASPLLPGHPRPLLGGHPAASQRVRLARGALCCNWPWRARQPCLFPGLQVVLAVQSTLRAWALQLPPTLFRLPSLTRLQVVVAVENTLRVVDANEVLPTPVFEGPIVRLAASPCGKFVGGYGQDGTVHIWTAGGRGWGRHLYEWEGDLMRPALLCWFLLCGAMRNGGEHCGRL